MTTEQWMTLLGPVLAALVLAAAGIITTVATGLTKRLGAYLDSKGQAEASRVIMDAAIRVQNAMQNEAGRIALEMQAGTLNVTDTTALLARAKQGEAAIMAKLPSAVDLLKPAQDAIAQGILGKLGMAPGVVAQ